MKFTMKQFNERFPTSDACLEELKAIRYRDWKCPQCGSPALSKIKGRSQYASPCGFQVSPMAGTIFHKSATDLRTWYMTMFLMTTTRAGVSAKTVERMTGVTYKTAWRMMKQIRTLMDTGDSILSGTVEIDEAYMQPNPLRDTRVPKGRHISNSKTLMGLTDGTTAIVKTLPVVSVGYVDEVINKHVTKGSTIHTDGALVYRSLNKKGYQHSWVDHHNHIYFANGVGTQKIEGFWGNLKRGMVGVYRQCGVNYLQSYANEYAWRYSNRQSDAHMFELLLGSVI